MQREPWGYRFFMLTSQDGIPIAAVVSKANKVEMSTIERLLRQVKVDRQAEGGDPSACYRCGYDEEKVYRDAQQLLCQVNPRRDADLRRFRDDRKLPSQKRKQHWIREVRDGMGYGSYYHKFPM